jgi:hypothetical protein
VYLIRLLIDTLALAPESGAEDADDASAVGDSHGEYAATNAAEALGIVQAQAQGGDRTQPVYDAKTMEQLFDEEVSGVRLSARMMSVFAIIALVLARGYCLARLRRGFHPQITGFPCAAVSV